MGCDVLDFQEIDRTRTALVGGKGAQLGELSRIDGIRVPAGFCVTTDAFQRIVAEAPSIDDRLDRLSRLKAETGSDPRAQRRDPPDDRSGRHPRRSRGGDHPRARPARRARRLRRPIERDGGGLADRLVRGPAGHVSQRHRAGGDPRARQPVLGVALQRAGGDVPAAERPRSPQGPHGRGRAADGFPAGGRHPVHGRSRHGQSEGRLHRGQLRAGRGAGLRPGERRRLQGARRRDRRKNGRRQEARHPRLARRRHAGGADRARSGSAAGAHGCAGGAPRAARPQDRSALRAAAGHRMVPGRRRLPHRPEPADHDAVPDPRGG